MSVHGGALTVDVRDAPLDRLLRRIAEVAGFVLTVRGDAGTPVTQTFTDVPLDDAIRRLARGYALAVTYAAPPDDPAAVAVTEVRILGRSPDRGAEAIQAAPDPPAGADDVQTISAGAERGGDAAVGRLGELALATDAAVRRQAVAALARLDGPEIERLLTDALADRDPAVRVRAVRGLRRLGTDTSAEAIATAVAADVDAGVRLAALRALTSLPGPSMLTTLASASLDSNPLVREAAARGLAWWRTRLR